MQAAISSYQFVSTRSERIRGQGGSDGPEGLNKFQVHELPPTSYYFPRLRQILWRVIGYWDFNAGCRDCYIIRATQILCTPVCFLYWF